MICLLCSRESAFKEHFEKHHLTPRCKKGKRTIDVCIDCGNQIHKLFTIKELCALNTLDLLLNHPRVKKWSLWVKNRPIGICMKSKKKR